MKTNSSNREFRKIPSLDFLYEINGNGTILRNVKSKKQTKIRLDMHLSNQGYYRACLCLKNKETGKPYTKQVMIHALVAECWLGPRPDGLQIDHIDRDSHNNDYRNLRYVTQSEQMKNRVLSKATIARATNNCMRYVAKISVPVTVMIDGMMFAKYQSITQASVALGLICCKRAEFIRAKMKKRRSHIYNFDVIYGNAETVRHRSTEQETVHN